MTRMLVVDDDPAWRALYRMAFGEMFEIFEASDGQHGLTLVDSVQPDVILLDLRMPRVDGVSFIRRLDGREHRPAVIVCSGALHGGERPSIPGVQIAPKTPDLKDLCTALSAAIPGSCQPESLAKHTPVSEDAFWKD